MNLGCFGSDGDPAGRLRGTNSPRAGRGTRYFKGRSTSWVLLPQPSATLLPLLEKKRRRLIPGVCRGIHQHYLLYRGTPTDQSRICAEILRRRVLIVPAFPGAQAMEMEDVHVPTLTYTSQRTGRSRAPGLSSRVLHCGTARGRMGSAWGN